MICFSFFFFKLESSAFTGQFIRADLPSYTDPIIYYGDAIIDPLQQNYSHGSQRKISHHFYSNKFLPFNISSVFFTNIITSSFSV
jgi:hypothetical protein